MSPVLLAAAFAGVLALGLGSAAVLILRRSGVGGLERRLKRVAAPLANPAAAQAQAVGAESIFRPREREARLAWVWAPLKRRYPFVHPPKAFAFAMGAGVAGTAFAAFALGFLRVPAGWWAVPVVSLAGALGARAALRWQQARQEAMFIHQFPEVVDQMVRLGAAGVPAVEALSVVAEDAQAPVRPVLAEVCDALQAGLDADRALRLATERVHMAEFTLFAAVLRLQRRSGGTTLGRVCEPRGDVARTEQEHAESACGDRADPPHAAGARGDAGARADWAAVHRAGVVGDALRHRAGHHAPSGGHRPHRHGAPRSAHARRTGGTLRGRPV